MSKISLKLLAVAFCLVIYFGCASIPSEAPELSAELGNRISALEEATINLLHEYFEFKRKDVDNFIQNNNFYDTFNNLT